MLAIWLLLLACVAAASGYLDPTLNNGSMLTVSILSRLSLTLASTPVFQVVNR